MHHWKCGGDGKDKRADNRIVLELAKRLIEAKEIQLLSEITSEAIS